MLLRLYPWGVDYTRPCLNDWCGLQPGPGENEGTSSSKRGGKASLSSQVEVLGVTEAKLRGLPAPLARTM